MYLQGLGWRGYESSLGLAIVDRHEELQALNQDQLPRFPLIEEQWLSGENASTSEVC